MKVATLIYCLDDDKVLLGMKKKDFGAGKWNGFGGKVKEGESIEHAAIRELEEESGLIASENDLQKVAKLHFYFGTVGMFGGHVFLLHSWQGEPIESDEMRPQWFPISAMPIEHMWNSDPLWLPRAILGEKVEARCEFDEKGEVVRKFEELAVSF